MTNLGKLLIKLNPRYVTVFKIFPWLVIGKVMQSDRTKAIFRSRPTKKPRTEPTLHLSKIRPNQTESTSFIHQTEPIMNWIYFSLQC